MVESDNIRRESLHEEESCKPTSLTVWKQSLFFSCNGFTIIDHWGNLRYRVDNYAGQRRMEDIVLMDAVGKPLLTMRRKKMSWHKSWLVFDGEVDDECKMRPICCVRKCMNLILLWQSKVLARVVFCVSSSSDDRFTYTIEGSYGRRSCRVYDDSCKVVVEIQRKATTLEGNTFGEHVFQLIIWPGLDPVLAMAVVVLLDKMFS
ncbi:Protein LURP-one-related 8 [Acorus gramineus]|uniref:Protein LURP-one-related 8 n=1 Tax=Acorus gramineus TaxID=55184 RepID=A0AAV9BNB7_ACOGR|nr:Protein LURP-one-related 8 [Acorus gramineus]